MRGSIFGAVAFYVAINVFAVSSIVPTPQEETDRKCGFTAQQALDCLFELEDAERQSTVRWITKEYLRRLSEIEPPITEPPSAQTIERHGITWHLAEEAIVGVYVNGDPWVVGPVTVVDIEPEPTLAGERFLNGCQVNPPADTWYLGYDGAAYAKEWLYRARLNACSSLPLELAPGSSLVSSISMAEPKVVPQLLGASVLTVLAEPPPLGSFRPPYCGVDKEHRWTFDQIQWGLLGEYELAAGAPSVDGLIRDTERVWLDHGRDWPGNRIHPKLNMPAYGRELASLLSTAYLVANGNVPRTKKEPLVVNLLQIGIDFGRIGELDPDRHWPAGGGHHQGRKWPILFSGLVLNDPRLVAIAQQVTCNEDDQTFYVEETSPGVFNYGQGGYTRGDVGLAEWGGQHWKQIKRGQSPTFDSKDWFEDPYRLCCTTNSELGIALSARMMGAVELWDHDAFFDYVDRYVLENRRRGITDWRLSWTPWPLAMWDQHRAGL